MNYKKRILSTVILFFTFGGMFSQQNVLSGGGDAEGTTGSVSFSCGQLVYTSNTGSNGTIMQGVQIPYEIYTVVGINETEISLSISVYPNPAENVLFLNIGDYENEKLSFHLYSIQGTLLESKSLRSNKTVIQTESLPNATYLLEIRNEHKVIKSFKIIKN